MVKKLPCNAGEVGLIPGRGTKIPQAAERLNVCTATGDCVTTETLRDPTEAPRATTKTQHSQIN